MKKSIFLTAVVLVAFSNFSAEANETINASFSSCEDQAFDAVETYYDNSWEDDGFTAGAIFEYVYNRCMNQ